ncbi:MAG: hypothetical protein KAV41_02060 [Candidatus Pacebacteria bacterium]|nr:hypothetical protein [Candidatus Paceibacterota bacterium]
MGKGKEEFEVEIEVWAGNENTGGKDNFQIYPWKEVSARKIKMREKLRPIVEAVEKVKLPVSTVVLLGNDYYLPLLVIIRKVGNFDFFKEYPGCSEGFQMFDSEEEMLLMANETEIQKEFRNKLLEFLEKKWKAKFSQAVSHRKELSKLIDESSKIGDLCARF